MFDRLFLNESVTVSVTNWVAVLSFGLLVGLAALLRDRDNPAIPSYGPNLLVVLLGSLAGWALAMFWVPFDESEKQYSGKSGRRSPCSCPVMQSANWTGWSSTLFSTRTAMQ